MRGRAISAFAVVGLLALWSAGFASASTRTYKVTFSGSGHFTSDVDIDLSPDCGDVTITRDEDTYFSWVDQWHLSLSVGSKVGSGKAEDKALPIAGEDNDSTVTLDGSGDGCMDGRADCKGESEPEPGWDSYLKVQGGKLTAEGVGPASGGKGWTPKDFSGTWADPDSILGAGSCDEYADDFDELLSPLIYVPAEFTASFPVRTSTWKSLKVGHYFKVKISEGHYAPDLPFYDNCDYEANGCHSQHLSFNGTVKVTRL